MWNYSKMILTGTKIKQELNKSKITIIPFNESQLNPNSYNYRVGDEIIILGDKKNIIKKIPKKGFVLQPNRVYLSNTYEILGSEKYAMGLIGRSSLGRLGLFLQVSANLGHTGAEHSWTLELVATRPFRIYPNMIIGQISFWDNRGKIKKYLSGYSRYNKPKISKFRRLR